MDLTNGEKIALQKVLNHVKFGCKEYETRYLAGSPIVAELYRKVHESLKVYYDQIGVEYPKEWPDIEEDYSHIIDVIIEHIRNTDNWLALDFESKRRHVETLIYPYRYKESLMKKLIEIGDNYHGDN